MRGNLEHRSRKATDPLRTIRLLALSCCAAVPAAADVDPPPRADVFVLGEVHDNPAHHALQARIVADVAPVALVFEMVDAEDAARVTDVSDADALDATLRWTEKGWPDFADYHPIFLAAPDARVVGADVPRDDLMAAMESDAATVLGADAAGFDPWPRRGPDHDALIAEQREAHCGMLPEDLLPGMVEAQRLRDAALALAVREAIESGGGPVAVITGNGHARGDRGVPALLASLAPDLTVWSLGQFETEPEPDAPFDAMNVTDPVDRPDPCLSLAD